jgi:hypothetical protein
VKVPRGGQRRGAGTDDECEGERDDEKPAARATMVRAEGVESRRTRTGRNVSRRLRQAAETGS